VINLHQRTPGSRRPVSKTPRGRLGLAIENAHAIAERERGHSLAWASGDQEYDAVFACIRCDQILILHESGGKVLGNMLQNNCASH
jgi:hypothetical protein